MNNREYKGPDASYTPAEIEITTKNVEMDADWEPVWEELGVLKPSTQAKELSAEARREILERISDRARNGRRIRDIHMEKGNIYGKIAFEKYMKSNKVDIRIEALPKFGVQIDVKIYPPEIRVSTKGVGE